MKRLMKPLTSLAIVAVTLAVATAGWTYWSAGGSGSGSASVGTLTAPGQPTGTTSTGAVTLQWAAATRTPAGAIDGYYVQRAGSAGTVDACGTASSPRTLITSLSCTDTNLAAGTYSYTVTAAYRSWTATSPSSSALVVSTVGPAAKLALGVASTNPTAGSSNNLTITAQDASGITATGYSGDKSLTFGGGSSIGGHMPTVNDKTGTAVPFGEPTTITFTAGVATVNGNNNGVMKLFKAGNTTITVGDGAINNGTGMSLFVNSAGAPLSFTAPVPTGAFLAGKNTTWSNTIAIGADPYGNAAQYASPGMSLTIQITGSDATHFTLATPSSGAFTATASPSPTFTVGRSDNASNKSATLTVAGPSGGGFTPVSATLRS